MLDKAFGALTKAKNADIVVFTLSRFEEFPDLWVSDSTFKDMKKVSNANPQQAQLHLGQVGADRVRQRRRQEAARDADQAGELRSVEEVPADGLHLRGAVAEPAPLRARRTSAPASTSRATSATATSCCSPTSSTTTGYPGTERREVRHPGGATRSSRWASSIRSAIGIQGHWWGGYQITYLITQTNMFARRRSGRVGVEHDQRLRRHPLGHRACRASSSTRRRRAASARRRGTRRSSSSRTRRSSGSKKIQTPYLTIHNDEDDAVPWQQGIEFITRDAPARQGSATCSPTTASRTACATATT